ncbi:ABC transporter permease [Rhodococcoides fascians A21d2]|uniref:ABC transporter permease n=1 Tax=Rhodococcoides fascians TaxID=1828 RepID=UPI0005698D4E|nr:ABC transporter permease [Rhodococcus fascians]QII01573.1 ABC transporter permease [Rhodococcus fascians A21d2]
MIWVTWRQFRATILLGVLTPLLLATITIAITKLAGGVAPITGIRGCFGFQEDYCTAETAQTIAILLTIALPVVIGAFVGVTVFSRDLERRTHVLGLTQSVSRRRWYGVRVLVVFVPTILAMALLGCALYWAKYRTSPGSFTFMSTGESRLDFPTFGATGFVSGGYTAAGLMLGAACALAMRNTVAAMITTVVLSTAFLALLPTQIREHYATPAVETQTLEQKMNDMYGGTPDYYRPLESISIYPRWNVSADYVDGQGTPVAIDLQKCTWPDNYRDMSEFETVAQYEEYADLRAAEDARTQIDCTRAQGADAFETKYHEDRLFWRFQAIETALTLLIAGLLGGLSLLLVKRLRP